MKTILVIGDEPAHAEALSLILQHEGYRVHCAAPQAAARASAVRPDLVILDFRPPAMAGVAAGHALRAPGGVTPLAILAMSVLAEDEVRAKFDGYDAFMSTPFNVKAALDNIGRLLS